MASPKWPVIVLLMLSLTMCSAHRVKVKNHGSAMDHKKDEEPKFGTLNEMDDGWVDHTESGGGSHGGPGDRPGAALINAGGYGNGGGMGGGGGGGSGWTSGGSGGGGGGGSSSDSPTSGGSSGGGYGQGGNGPSGGGGVGTSGSPTSGGSSGGGYAQGGGGGGGGWTEPGWGSWGMPMPMPMPPVGAPYLCQLYPCPITARGSDCKGFMMFIDHDPANVKPMDKEKQDGRSSPPNDDKEKQDGVWKQHGARLEKEKQDGKRLGNEKQDGERLGKGH